MPGDLGDELAEKSNEDLKQILIWMLAHQPGRRAASRLLDSVGKRAVAIKNSITDALDEKSGENADVDLVDDIGDELEAVSEPMRVYVATDAEDAEFIQSLLDNREAEYTTDIVDVPALCELDGAEQLWTFEVSEREFSAPFSAHFPFSQTEHPIGSPRIDFETAAALQYFSIERYASAAALLEAMADTTDKIPAVTLIPGDTANIRLGFKTVKWDPEATIITDPLERARVPYSLEHDRASHVIIEVDRCFAAQLQDITDFHLENPSSHITPERFDGLGYLSEARSDPKTDASHSNQTQIIELPIEDKVTAQQLRWALDSKDIAYEARTAARDGSAVFYLSTTEIDAKRSEISALIDDIDKHLPLVPSRDIDLAHQDISKLPKRQKAQSAYRSGRKKATPAKDRELAKASAKARNAAVPKHGPRTQKINPPAV